MSTETVAFNIGAGIYAKPIEDACIRCGIDTAQRIRRLEALLNP